MFQQPQKVHAHSDHSNESQTGSNGEDDDNDADFAIEGEQTINQVSTNSDSSAAADSCDTEKKSIVEADTNDENASNKNEIVSKASDSSTTLDSDDTEA